MMTGHSEFARFLKSVSKLTKNLDSNDVLDKVHEGFESENFGNAIVIYQWQDILLRFSKDRGDVLLDISNAQYGEWWSLDSVANILGEDPPGLDVSSVGRTLTKLFERIKSSFAASEYPAFRQKLDAEAKRRVESFRARQRQ